jgi:hypothetical protein
MRRFLLLATMTLLMVAMLAASAMPAMAVNEHACNQGTVHAHNAVPQPDNPAHEHIPLCG